MRVPRRAPPQSTALLRCTDDNQQETMMSTKIIQDAGTIKDTAKIKLIAKENPCRKGSARHKRFELLRRYTGKTVSAYIAGKGRMSTLWHWIDAGVVKVVCINKHLGG